MSTGSSSVEFHDDGRGPSEGSWADAFRPEIVIFPCQIPCLQGDWCDKHGVASQASSQLEMDDILVTMIL
jgi:hypothetical protein